MEQVWHFFDHAISPTTCYYSYSITRIEVMSEGVNVRLTITAILTLIEVGLERVYARLASSAP